MSTPWVAFYSVKGGVGRSTILTLCALELARHGLRVVAVDFDLESPGLDILLTPEDTPEAARRHEGVVDFLDARARGEPFPVERIIVPRPLPSEYTGSLFLISAGRCDDRYLAALDRLNLKQLYQRSGLLNPVRALRAELEETLKPDIVLVDSHAGFSDAALVSLFDLADTAAVVLPPERQNVERLEPVLRRLSLSMQQHPMRQLVLVVNELQPAPSNLQALRGLETRLRELAVVKGTEGLQERTSLHHLPFDQALTWPQRLPPSSTPSEPLRALVERLHGLAGQPG